MKTAQLFRVKNNQFRAISFVAQEADGAPAGQQMIGWLPAGEYQVIGRESVTVSDFGRASQVGCVRLVRRGVVYYVAEAAATPEMIALLPE